MNRVSSASRSHFFLVLALAIIWTPPAFARTTIIDDSGTQALEPSVTLRWKSTAPPRNGRNNTMIGSMTLRVHLNVTPWLKRHARIYLTLPAQPPGPITARWSAQGRFAPGEVNSGNRVLVYSGPITAPFLEDVMTFQFSVEGSVVRRPFPVTFHFEMDED